ncbi:hypothetical protein [Candidatus Methylomirabilis sp.]|uniref:Uncharacterized protein n=1 Tax=Candidatus Methylomirabilis tolerans TaxID=3123416 RepID=A0AAJ1AKB1_9BACT|nr:hypothetical protein [Candidatus Methylomirabilis sp.]
MLTVKQSRARPLEALVFVLMLLLFAFAAGLHSMHNIGHLNQAAQCAVASASTHLAGTAVESVILEIPALPLEIVPGTRFTDPSIACLGPAHGRAPPSCTA